MAAKRGTDLHELAHMAIRLGVKFPKNRITINMYVNDGIGFGMAVEQPLYYSPNCFGHADTINFRNEMLRIHDLKNGAIPAHMHQLEVYAALFCLEYTISPFDIGMELRIYQSDDIRVNNPDPEMISQIMEKIVIFDNQIESMREVGQW